MIPNGTKFTVPNYKIKWGDGNPAGHASIFIGTAGPIDCSVAPGGV